MELSDIFSDGEAHIQNLYAGFTASTVETIHIYDWYFKNGSSPVNLDISLYKDVSNVVLIADPQAGSAASTITAEVSDVDGNPAADVPVDISTSFGTLGETPGTTDASGQVSSSLSSATSGTATVTAIAEGGGYDSIDVQLTVTDADKVSFDSSWLTEERLLGGNGSLTSVTEDVYLPRSGPNGSSITWASSNEDFVTVDGDIYRPSYEQGDQSVVLTAEISKGDDKAEKTFTLKVLAPTDEAAVAVARIWRGNTSGRQYLIIQRHMIISRG